MNAIIGIGGALALLLVLGGAIGLKAGMNDALPPHRPHNYTS